MFKKHIFLLFCEIKSAVRIIPRFLLCLIISGVVLFCLVSVGKRMLGYDNATAISFKVAAVIPKNDAEVALAFDIISKTDSVSKVCELILMDADSAYQALKQGEIAAAVIIPENFVNDLMYGVNTPAEVIIPDNPGTESLLFCSLISAGALSLARSEAGMYAVLDLFTGHDRHDAAAVASDKLYNRYLQYTLNRDKYFRNLPLSSTGPVDTATYYWATGFILLMFLCGIVFCDFFTGKRPDLCGISRFYPDSCGYLAVCIMYLLIFGGILFGFGKVGFTPKNIGAFAVTVMSLVAFIQTVCMVMPNIFSCMITIFLSGSAMAYLCGRIVPSVFLPRFAGDIGKYLPMSRWCSLTQSMTTSDFEGPDFLLLLIFTAICFILCGLAKMIKRRWQNA